MTKEEAIEALTDVKRRTDLVQLIADSGVRLTQSQTGSHLGTCPFCNTKRLGSGEPSFAVNQAKGFFHCFTCKEAGSAIDFVMRRHGSNFAEAVWWLSRRLMSHA